MTITCVTCRRPATDLDPMHQRPVGWLRLTMGGDARPAADQPQCATYCTTECLLIEILRCYGLGEQAVRDWLKGPATSW
jgi:hypothetical protein